MVVFTIENISLELATPAGEMLAGTDRFGYMSPTFDTDRLGLMGATILDSTGNLYCPERSSRSTPRSTIPTGGRYRGNQSPRWSDGSVRRYAGSMVATSADLNSSGGKPRNSNGSNVRRSNKSGLSHRSSFVLRRSKSGPREGSRLLRSGNIHCARNRRSDTIRKSRVGSIATSIIN